MGTYCCRCPSITNRVCTTVATSSGCQETVRDRLRAPGRHGLRLVKRNGVVFCELAIDLSGTLPQMPPQTPTFVFKAMPRIDLQPGFDGPVLLCRQQTAVEPRRIEIGTPR